MTTPNAVIAKTAGDGTDPRKGLIPETGVTKLASLTGNELLLVQKPGDKGEYYATVQEIANVADSQQITQTFLQADVASGSAVSLTTGTAADIATVALTEGTWLVSAAAYFKAAGTTTVTRVQASLSDTLNTMDTTDGNRFGGSYLAGATGTNIGLDVSVTGLTEIKVVASTATLHLVGLATFATSTMTAYGHITAVQIAP